MSEPTGLLAWGQAATYDAADDRAVIAAVTGGRTGLAAPAAVTAGTGLQITVAPGWLGVAACGDGTSAVVGSRLAQVVMAAPGPASGSREDVLWCDVEPDEGQWQLVVVPAAASAGRPGLAVAFITVPANATLASQMTIRPATATLERRLVAWHQSNETANVTGTTWAAARELVWCDAVVEPGRNYRVRFTAVSTMKTSGTLEGRIGVGFRLAGQPDSASQLARGSAIHFARLGAATQASVEWVFYHNPASGRITRTFNGKVWPYSSGGINPTQVTNEGIGLMLTVEDLGSGP